jgi:signal transduction histidine kinase
MRWRTWLALGLLLAVAGLALVDAELGGWLVGGPVLTMATVVAAYLAGAWLPPALAGVTSLGAVAMLTAANQLADPGRYTAANDFFFFAVLVGGVALAGNLVSARARQVKELRALSAIREEQRTRELEAARLEERTRVDAGVSRAMMQRLSALVVQAAGVRRERASRRDRDAVARVEAGGRETLDELREVLGTLHEPPPAPSAAPGPGELPRSRTLEPPIGWVDVLVACSGLPVAVECVVTITSRGPAVANVVAGVALGLPLAWRRHHPLLSSSAFILVAILMSSLLTPLGGTVAILLPLSLVAYGLGAHTRGAHRVVALVLLLGGGLLVSVANASADDTDGLLPSLLWVGLAFGAGGLAAQHTDRAARLVDLLARVEAGRDDEVRLAVAEQRQALARDLHDTVAHAMTVVCLHAEAAQQQWSDDRAVEQSLAVIESATREAMTHLRTGLGVLETEGDAGEVLPGKVLADEVAAFAGSLGVPVTTSADVALSPDAQTLVRRLVREALVNTARHAAGSSAHVRVARDRDLLVIEISNTAAASPGFGGGSGRGLAGLQERFASHGGRVEHGPTAEGGYGVTAYLPTPRTRVPA